MLTCQGSVQQLRLETGGQPLGKVMRPLSGTDAPWSIDRGLALTDRSIGHSFH